MSEETSGHCQIHHADLTKIADSLGSIISILCSINAGIGDANSLLRGFSKSIDTSADPEKRLLDIMLQKIIDAEKEKYYDD